MSSSKHSKIFENILAAADSNELLADLDQCATVLAENSWPKRDHPALQTGSYQPQTAYNIMWTILFKRPDTSQMSKEQKDKFIAKQLSFRQNWYITGTLNAPWTTIRLENLISRLKNIIIDHVAACMGKVGAITPAMRSLFTAEVTEANQACIADNEQTAVKHSALLTAYPYTLTPDCVQAIKLYAQEKYSILVDDIARGTADQKAKATAAFADKIKIVTGALAAIQLVVNHTMLKSLGELLTPIKKGGLVLPKLLLAYQEHYEKMELKAKSSRKPFSSVSAIKIIRNNCTGTNLNLQNEAKRAIYLLERMPAMNIYDWFNAFKIPLKQLRLSGAVMPAIDSSEHQTYLHEIFCPQLSQHEVNTLHNRGFTGIKDNKFVTATLQTELGQNTEVYGKYSQDKRVRTYLQSRAKIFKLPNTRHSRPDESSSRPKRQKNFIAGNISLIRPQEWCKHPMCIQAGNHKNHTAAVCHRSSSSPYGKGKGGKGRGKGKARALFVGKGKGGKSSKGKQGKGKGRGLGLYNKTTTGRSSNSIAPVKHVPGQAYSGTCFFCKKPGHAQKDCNAKKRLEAQPLFLTESTSFTGAAAVSLEKLTAAVGTNTCQECYSHTCHGPGNCDPNDISPYLPEAEARFINSGLYDLTLRMKNGASSGLQRNETPLQSTAFVTDTHSLQGHGAYGDHYYNGGYGGYDQPYFQEGGYDSHGAYHVQASQSHPYDHLQASSYENYNQPCQVDLNGHRSYNRPWGTHDPPNQAYNYDRSGNSQSWNYDREQVEQEQKPQPGDVLITENHLQDETQQSGEWPDPGGQAEYHEEQLPELLENDESDSDSDTDSDNESRARHDSSSSSE
jgi:hypothetical protein